MQCPYCDALLDHMSLVTNVCSSCHEVLGDINQTMRTLRLDHQVPLTDLELKSYGHGAKTVIATDMPTGATKSPDDDFIPDAASDAPAPESTTSRIVLNRRRFSSTGDRDADYEIIGKLGEGGMGIIQKARQNSLNRIVAIKQMGAYQGKDAKEHFTREAVITGALQHPNIVPIYDLGANDDDQPFYAMKIIDGHPWSEDLAGNGFDKNLDILLHVCDAVAYAHAQNIIHRDLKPENVMIGQFGEIILMDWGLAAGVGEQTLAPRVRYEDAIAGTPAYMAPEMARGEEKIIDKRSDIYLLGAILFEIITLGERPHSGASIRECLQNASENRIVDAEVNSPILPIAMKAMAAKPEDRYGSVAEFQRAIRTGKNSVTASTHGRKALAKAKKTHSYHDFFQAIGSFIEAIEIWDGNQDAKTCLDVASRELAETAFRNGDLNLAQSLLSSDNPDDARLLQSIEERRSTRQEMTF